MISFEKPSTLLLCDICQTTVCAVLALTSSDLLNTIWVEESLILDITESLTGIQVCQSSVVLRLVAMTKNFLVLHLVCSCNLSIFFNKDGYYKLKLKLYLAPLNIFWKLYAQWLLNNNFIMKNIDLHKKISKRYRCREVTICRGIPCLSNLYLYKIWQNMK